MEKVFGIDLGTTYSCISYVDEHGKPVIVANFENERTTPSVVAFEESSDIIVGNEAKNMLKTEPEKVVSFIKRSMGDPSYIFVYNGIEYKPEEISSYILRKLTKDASENTGIEVKNVVITCPAYFGENEREATRLAGEIAGLTVKSIINEPTAAALTYGVDQSQNQTVLVYDLGGGTFDITMIQVRPEAIEVVVTGGDHDLGGKNWDDRLMSHFAEEFKNQTGVEADIFDSPTTLGDLQLSAEAAKKTLTQRDKTKVSIQYETDRANVEISKEKFEELTNDLIEKTITLTKDMLAQAAKEKNVTQFDKILMVGGSTKMPQVRASLEATFPGTPIESFDPDESVAKGAALFGQQLMINGEVLKRLAEKLNVDETEVKLDDVSQVELDKVQQEVASKTGYTLGQVKTAGKKIVNVLSKSYGLLAYINGTDQKVVNLLMKQSPVPIEYTEMFSTHKAGQDSIEITVFENEMNDGHVDEGMSKEIGQGLIENIPTGLPANSPIQVTFKMNEEGLLEIYAKEMTGGKELKMTITCTNVISGKELEEAIARSKGIKVS